MAYKDFFRYEQFNEIQEERIFLGTTQNKQSKTDKGVPVNYSQTVVMYNYAADGEEPRLAPLLHETKPLNVPYGMSDPDANLKNEDGTPKKRDPKKKVFKYGAYSPLSETKADDVEFIEFLDYLWTAIVRRCIIPNSGQFRKIKSIETAESMLKSIYKVPEDKNGVRAPSKPLSFTVTTSYNTVLKGMDDEIIKPEVLNGVSFEHIPLIGYTIFVGDSLISLTKNWYESTITKLNSVSFTNFQESRRRELANTNPELVSKYREEKEKLLTAKKTESESTSDFGVAESSKDEEEQQSENTKSPTVSASEIVRKTSSFSASKLNK